MEKIEHQMKLSGGKLKTKLMKAVHFSLYAYSAGLIATAYDTKYVADFGKHRLTFKKSLAYVMPKIPLDFEP